ncbi:MAG: hypothetical protein AB8B87_25900 [Granulosicoccus sp.]
MKASLSLLTLVPLVLVACGGGPSGDIASTTVQTQEDLPGGMLQEPTSIPGQELIGDLIVERFEQDGVTVEILEYGVSPFDEPQLSLSFNNNTGAPVYGANCNINGLQADGTKEVAKAFFANLYPIDSGEAALGKGAWIEFEGTFASFTDIELACEWLDGDDDRMDNAGPVSVEFSGYRSSFFGSPGVGLVLTNNSPDTIYGASCGVEAKRGNVIVDVASVFFANDGDINSGEASEEDGAWLGLSSIDDFDSEPFNIDNVNCNFLVR